MIGALLLLAGMALADEAPSDHTLIYYNARMALREDRPAEAVKLWLLRNALEEQTHTVSPHDQDFRSVTWAALGDLGVCQDGFPVDEYGAGLWPLALYNWVVRNRNRRSRAKRPSAFDAFELDRQQRPVSIGDVLGSQELRTVQLRRGACLRPLMVQVAAGQGPRKRLSDPHVALHTLEQLLLWSQDSLAPGQVRGTSAIEARLFDIHLSLTALAARDARRQERERARRGRDLGLSRPSVAALRADEPEYLFAEGSEASRILHQAVDWPVEEWMALSPDRRLFLFDHARAYTKRDETLDRLALAIVDQLAEEGDGAEVERWIARCNPDHTEQIWGGERGYRLMALDREGGFRERSVLALHRGVSRLEEGDLPGSLRDLAFALHHASDSRRAGDVQSLSIRWLTYTSAHFQITEELLDTLELIVTSREYNVILEDLIWSAAFRADRPSFERGMRSQVGHGALERRVALLDPLAAGDLGAFLTGIREGLSESPSETLRFLTQLVQRLELEDADVRADHLPTLVALRELLLPVTEADSGRQVRLASELRDRSQAMIEGLGGTGQARQDKARAVDPDTEVYAGAVRLIPVDPLPWPFEADKVTSPSVFVPMQLTPVEWRDDQGELVFGWSIEG